jgi:hypothetical protein
MRGDPLLQTIEDIRHHAQQAGLAIFYTVLGDREDDLLWINEQGKGWENFINVAVAAGVKVLYMSWAQFEEFQVDEALEAARARAESAESYDPDLERKIERFRDKVGLIAEIELGFYLQDTMHVYRLYPEWFDAFEELVSALEEDEEEEELPPEVRRNRLRKWALALASHPKFSACRGDDERKYLLETIAGEEYEKLPVEDIVRRAEVIYTFEVDKTPVRKWAAALASHPQFSRCKTYSQRSYLLETMAGDEYGNLPVDEIISLADAMYTIDVLPKEEERLRTEAHRLRKQGLSLTAISGKLGISRDRVYAFLPEEKKRRRKLNLPDQSPQRRVRRAPHRKVAGPHGLSARRRARV